MTDNVVEFVVAEFRGMYPKITVSDLQLESFFYEAELLFNNTVSSEYGTLGNSEKWWVQTPYGAKFWQMTAIFRTSLYVVTNFPMPVNRR